jgi:hypothetical protein
MCGRKKEIKTVTTILLVKLACPITFIEDHLQPRSKLDPFPSYQK